MKIISDYKMKFENDKLEDQIQDFFKYYEKKETAIHSKEVANEAKYLAHIFDLPEKKAYASGLLHDISAVIPNKDRVQLQILSNEPILKEEKELPMMLHQKQSVLISKEIFGVNDVEILSAIESHTTLKKNATSLDKLVFVADKIKWDRKYSAPYLAELNEALQVSLDEACRVYINWALNDIIVLHPWLKDAMDDLGISYLSSKAT